MLENVSNKNSSIHLTPPPNLALLFNQFNNTTPEQNVDSENVVNSRYFDIDEIQALKLHPKKVSLSSIKMHAHCNCQKLINAPGYMKGTLLFLLTKNRPCYCIFVIVFLLICFR